MSFTDSLCVEDVDVFSIFDEFMDDLDDGCIETDSSDWIGVDYDA